MLPSDRDIRTEIEGGRIVITPDDPGVRTGQVRFVRLATPAEHPRGWGTRGSRYGVQRGPAAPRSRVNFHRMDV